jgi:hypothetical protein
MGLALAGFRWLDGVKRSEIPLELVAWLIVFGPLVFFCLSMP